MKVSIFVRNENYKKGQFESNINSSHLSSIEKVVLY